MNILVIDDELGIREGVAAYLRIKGHRACVAASLQDACQAIQDGDFDLLITDWRLDHELAHPIVDLATCPCIVVSGCPEDIPDLGDGIMVLAKPVPLEKLLDHVETATAEPEVIEEELWDKDIPVDTRDRVRLALALLGEKSSVQILDDGTFVTLRAKCVDGATLTALELLGGDLHVKKADGIPQVELRLYQNGLPDGVSRVIKPGEPWPCAAEPLAVDFHDMDCSPAEFVELVDAATDARAQGRDVYLLNVPSHLNFFLEALGRGDELPKRPMSGPRMPEELCELWR